MFDLNIFKETAVLIAAEIHSTTKWYRLVHVLHVDLLLQYTILYEVQCIVQTKLAHAQLMPPFMVSG